MGSNVDLTTVRANTGFVAGNTISFNSTDAIGYTHAFGSHNAAFKNYVGTLNVSASTLRNAKKSLAVDTFYTQNVGDNSTTSTTDNKTEVKV